jgi:hypothetical protein
MYARVDQISSRPGHSKDSAELADLSTGVTGQAGLLGSITFRQLAGPAAVCLTLWDSEASATGLPAPGTGPTAPSGEIYQVAVAEEGLAVAQAPAYARLLYFDGPRAPEQAAAEERAGRQRIWPVVRDIGGLVGAYVLRGPDFGTVVITLATSVEALDAAGRAVMATELLPGEDPALLPGPDRIEIHYVTGYDKPTIGQAASRKGH